MALNIPINQAFQSQSCQVAQLACIRGERVLFDDLSFQIDPSECVHIIGANGSGKTSLLRMIAGLNNADSGIIRFFSASKSPSEDLRPNLAYLGHSDGLKTELSAYENLSFYANLVSTIQSIDASQIDQLLHRMGLLACADLITAQMSFGQRRRLAFARLLIAPKQLWILDEPFTGIDHDGRALIEALCVQHLSAGGSIILSNHQDLSSSQLAPFLSKVEL